MYDPRWDDARERDDGRARVYGERDRADRDPRHGLMHDLDLPCGEARELVVDRDRVYELNGEDSRTLAAVGAFRVAPEGDLGSDRDDTPDHDTLDHLRDEGLIRTIALGKNEQAVVLTNEGRRQTSVPAFGFCETSEDVDERFRWPAHDTALCTRAAEHASGGLLRFSRPGSLTGAEFAQRSGHRVGRFC